MHLKIVYNINKRIKCTKTLFNFWSQNFVWTRPVLDQFQDSSKTGSRICFKKCFFWWLAMCVVYMAMYFFGIFFANFFANFFAAFFAYFLSAQYKWRVFFIAFYEKVCCKLRKFWSWESVSKCAKTWESVLKVEKLWISKRK